MSPVFTHGRVQSWSVPQPDETTSSHQAAGAVLLLLLLLAAWLLYSFDPWLGLLVGVLVLAYAIPLVASAVGDDRTTQRRQSGAIALVDDDDNDHY